MVRSTASSKACCTHWINIKRLSIRKLEALINSRTSLSSLKGMGSKRHVNCLEEVIAEVTTEVNSKRNLQLSYFSSDE